MIEKFGGFIFVKDFSIRKNHYSQRGFKVCTNL
jgi:hypothetical protein